jgi:hypothetical protein
MMNEAERERLLIALRGVLRSEEIQPELLVEHLRPLMNDFLKPMRALEDLTPHGSEFVGDVNKCVGWIRSVRIAQHDRIVKSVKEVLELTKELTILKKRHADLTAKYTEREIEFLGQVQTLRGKVQQILR